MSRLGVVSVHFHPEHVDRTLDALRSIVGEAEVAHVAVMNHPSVEARLRAAGSSGAGSLELLPHDNAGMEFGAYQAGLDRLLPGRDLDWVLFANDTLENTANFAAPYREIVRGWLGRELPEPAIVGKQDQLARSFQIDAMRTHRWIRTHIFALNRSALSALHGKIHRPDLDRLVRLTTRVEGFFSDELDAVLRDHLEVFLFRTRPGPHWYRTASLEGEQGPRTVAKARSILQEKFLSVRLEDAGARFCDVRALGPWPNLLRKVDDVAFELMHRRP